MRTLRLAATLALTLVALPAGAQNVSTGVNTTPVGGGEIDNDWSVRATRHSNGEEIVGWSNARVVNPIPSPPWQPNMPGSFRWIGADFDGTLNTTGITADGAWNFDYYFRRTLDALAGGSLMFRCTTDNALLMFLVNGTPTGASCPFHSFGGFQTIALGAGINTIEFQLRGDGVTDGLLVDATLTARPLDPTAVPEPATVVLTATGLLVLAGVARRRNKNA